MLLQFSNKPSPTPYGVAVKEADSVIRVLRESYVEGKSLVEKV